MAAMMLTLTSSSGGRAVGDFGGPGARRRHGTRQSRLPLRRPSDDDWWGGRCYYAAWLCHCQGRTCSGQGGTWQGCSDGASDGLMVRHLGWWMLGSAAPLRLYGALSLLNTVPPLAPHNWGLLPAGQNHIAIASILDDSMGQDPALPRWILAAARQWGSLGIVELKLKEMKWCPLRCSLRASLFSNSPLLAVAVSRVLAGHTKL